MRANGSGRWTPRPAPLEHPNYYQYEIDTTEVAEVGGAAAWSAPGTGPGRRRRCTRHPSLEEFAGRVSDSGEGRWTSTAAIDVGVPAPVLTQLSIHASRSRGLDGFADKLLSAMRKEFGGHDEKAE